jgi:short-subunit dehydrogenase
MRNPKVITITGASSGLGAALARAYAASGVTLYLTGRDTGRLEDIANECRVKGAKVECLTCDITDAKKIASWLTQIDRHTPVDMVIANAGVSAGTLGGEDVTQVRTLFATNINGVINTVHPLLALMCTRRRGQIVIISSMAGLLPLPSSPAYSASKAAVMTYGDALRGVLMKDRVGVTVVTPGYIKTPMTAVNQFPMPGLVSAEKAAQLIKQRLVNNPARIIFPRWLYYGIRCINMLPLSVRIALLNTLPAKPNMKHQEDQCTS